MQASAALVVRTRGPDDMVCGLCHTGTTQEGEVAVELQCAHCVHSSCFHKRLGPWVTRGCPVCGTLPDALDRFQGIHDANDDDIDDADDLERCAVYDCLQPTSMHLRPTYDVSHPLSRS